MKRYKNQFKNTNVKFLHIGYIFYCKLFVSENAGSIGSFFFEFGNAIMFLQAILSATGKIDKLD